jgi:hypothetical protein
MNETHKDINDTAIKQRIEWVKSCDEKGKLAEFINGHIKHIYDNVIAREKQLADKESMITDFKSRLAKLGIVWDDTINNWGERYKVLDQINIFDKRVNDDLFNKINYVGKHLLDLGQDMKQYQDKLMEQNNNPNMSDNDRW